MSYAHIRTHLFQESFEKGKPCGDIVVTERSPDATTIVICDGIGHGVRANVAANFCISRFLNLLKRGFSLRRAFMRVVKSMHEIRGVENTYAVFSVLRILHNGETTILTYEMPEPILISQNYASSLVMRKLFVGKEVIAEANYSLKEGEALFLVSDGIAEAGLGFNSQKGWSTEKIIDCLNSNLQQGFTYAELPFLVKAEADSLNGNVISDDSTIFLAECCVGEVVNIFTGPPLERADDQKFVSEFLACDGSKIVCGSSTCDLIARVAQKKLSNIIQCSASIAPPYYDLEGIDLATEGALTLNQVYHILDADPDNFSMPTGVNLLCQFLLKADKINIYCGQHPNSAHKDLSFRQQGILPRETIVPLLKEKLEKMGKLVILQYV